MTTETSADSTRRSVRTFIQTVLAGVATVLIAYPLVEDFLTEWFPGSAILGWAAVGVAFIGGLAATITKVMAIPAVDAWLSSIHLGKDATPARHRAE